MLRGEAGKVVPSAHDYTVHSCKAVAPSSSVEQELQVRPAVVGSVSSELEWRRHDVSSGVVWLWCNYHI